MKAVHLVDVVGLIVLIVLIAVFTLVIARQRYMLRSPGGIPLAVLGRSRRWQYGVGRYLGDELQWFRAMGIGTRPSRRLRRENVQVLGRHAAANHDLTALPPGAVIVECRDLVGDVTLGLSEGAYTGFVSWLEASAPRF